MSWQEQMIPAVELAAGVAGLALAWLGYRRWRRWSRRAYKWEPSTAQRAPAEEPIAPPPPGSDFTRTMAKLANGTARTKSPCRPGFEAAQELAAANGMALVRHSDVHYALKAKGAIWNLYPTTGRIYADPNHKGPFLRVRKPWTFEAVVRAAIEAKTSSANGGCRETLL